MPTTSTTSERRNPPPHPGLPPKTERGRGRGPRAFTLIELLAVMAIVVLLGSITLGAMTVVRANARKKATRSILAQVVSALNDYKQDWGWFPPDNNGPIASGQDNYGIKNLHLALGGHAVCSRCRYIYDEARHDNIPLNDPRRATWTCPVCASPRERFAPQKNYLGELRREHIGRGRPELDLDHNPATPPTATEITSAILDAWGQPLKYETLYNKSPVDPTGPPPSETYDQARWKNEFYHYEQAQYVLYSYGPD